MAAINKPSPTCLLRNGSLILLKSVADGNNTYGPFFVRERKGKNAVGGAYVLSVHDGVGSAAQGEGKSDGGTLRVTHSGALDMQGQGGPGGSWDISVLPNNSCLVVNPAKSFRLSSTGGRLFADAFSEERGAGGGAGTSSPPPGKQHQFVVEAAKAPRPGGPVLSVGSPEEVEFDERLALCEDQKRAFIRDGFLHLPNLVPPALVAAALKEVNAALYASAAGGGQAKGPAKGSGAGAMSTALNDEGVLVFSATPAVFDLLFCSGAWTAAQSLLGQGKAARPAGAQVAIRPPDPTLAPDGGALGPSGYGERDGKKWHIDGMQKGRHSPFSILLGVALSDVPLPLMGNFCVFPGSHHLIFPQVKAQVASGSGLFSNENAKEKPDLGPAHQVTAAAGDVVLCHHKLAHRGGANACPHIRYQLYFRVSHVDHEQLKESGVLLDDLWCEFEGVRQFL